ncbi:hypothetical protein CRV05_06495 [Halarcobacter bivalviorum]|uniref:HTH araC/xylS-type domain-containing protein n=2 Tax=Halarcobacter bivalviorum TaxID=663364 RepID=A0AAX2A6Y6_9BACT|nr:hypothetical protein CRV05_06495 [Halarcobacter bivalviorum]
MMNKQILKVLHYIETHLDDELSINTLAKIAGYSPFYFCKIFKASVGESVMSYALRLKINKASTNIINTKNSIIEIAFDIGFETPNGFNKAFKKVFNMTPTEYRSKHVELLCKYKENRMKQPEIKYRETVYVIYNTKYGAYENSVCTAWDELIWKLDSQNRINILSNSELFGICYSDPETTPENEIRYDAAISCKKEEVDTFIEKGFYVKKIEGGKFATLSYFGKDETNRVWMDLFSWIVENNLSNQCKNIPPFEKYLNWSPEISDEEIIKEIYIPLD